MANVIFSCDLSAEDKLNVMNESARYDIADDNDMAGCLSDSSSGLIKAPSQPPKVPKLFVSNDCIFNCAYCGCRSSNDKRRYVNTPEEMARIAVQAAQRNGHGVFVTSAIYRNPDYTVELIVRTLRLMRYEHNYRGYIHAKIMPGTDTQLIDEAGQLADRLSINIELPKSEGYALIAKQKSKSTILSPMAYISERIKESQWERRPFGRRFARSGQTTQMMVGTMQETDRTLICLAEALYRKFELRRVYYSAFSPVQEYEYLPSVATPKWRARRLYQADRLVQLYGFAADDLAPEGHPNFSDMMDPKASWALRNIHMYPVEINTADYETLLRIPGIGITSAKKILEARKHCHLTHDILPKLHISMKRARYFVTCNGRYAGGSLLGTTGLEYFLYDKPSQLSIFDVVH